MVGVLVSVSGSGVSGAAGLKVMFQGLADLKMHIWTDQTAL